MSSSLRYFLVLSLDLLCIEIAVFAFMFLKKEVNVMGKLKQCIMPLTILFCCLNLCSCGQDRNEVIEVGLKTEHQGNAESLSWLEFFTGLKAKSQTQKKQELEVFFGNSMSLFGNLNQSYYDFEGKEFEMDKSQILEFKLTRYVFSSDNDAIHGRIGKSEIVLSTQNTLGYFMSEEFEFGKNSMIDTIEPSDLVAPNDEYGLLEYRFSITPAEDEPIRISIDGNPVPVYSHGSICSYHHGCIGYTITDEYMIKFVDLSQ